MSAGGWLIGVMIEVGGDPAPARHYFAVGCQDRARAEWRAIDAAQRFGDVAMSPVGGLEPVHMIDEMSPKTVKDLALKVDEVRSLGWRWPRRWVTPAAPRVE